MSFAYWAKRFTGARRVASGDRPRTRRRHAPASQRGQLAARRADAPRLAGGRAAGTIAHGRESHPLADHRYAPACRACRRTRRADRPAGRHASGGRLRDLRISVTDRCNFRCSYCMPKEVFDKHYEFLPHSSLLSFEEITRVARAVRRRTACARSA